VLITSTKQARHLFITKAKGCRSFDCVIGKTVESSYKDEGSCDGCKYRYGFMMRITRRSTVKLSTLFSSNMRILNRNMF
jgi:hypothetical protein